METNPENKINKPEIHFEAGELILQSGGGYSSLAKALVDNEKDVLLAVKELYLRKTPLDEIRGEDFEDREFLTKVRKIKEEQEEVSILSFLEVINKEFPDIPWDVESVFESSTINMISAPPNQYKSWIVQHVAICLAQGKDVFGKFKTKKQNVLVINEEDNLRMIKDRSLKMIDEVSDLGIHFMVMSGFKVDGESIDKVCDEAEKRDVTFIIFDSLRSVHNANENDSQAMQEIMDLFKILTRKGFTVLFTHHNRKKPFGKNGNKDDLGEESRGSTAINAAVHGHLSCEEIFKEDGKYLIISQRKLKCDEKLQPFLVKVEIDKENKKVNFPFIGGYDSKGDTLRKNKDLTIKTIENSDRWLSKKEIAILVGVAETAQAKILQELEKDNMVDTKTAKELRKLNIQILDSDAKHNAKFYFRKEVDEVEQMVLDQIQRDVDAFSD